MNNLPGWSGTVRSFLFKPPVLLCLLALAAGFFQTACPQSTGPGDTSWSYTVSFNSNGGDTEANPASKTVTSPATTVGTLPEAPTRTGYVFTGWNTQADGGGSAFSASTPVTADITVYAQWQSTSQAFYVVIFDNNGGDTAAAPSYVTVSSPAITVENLPTPPTRNEYLFIGWNTQADGGGSAFTASTPVSANITVYAQWYLLPPTGTTYIVVFNSNGGDTEADPAAQAVISPVVTVGTLPEPPTRSGYTFMGWNTQANGGGSAFTASTTVTANSTVYAQWQLIPPAGTTYTVTFDRNGGDTEANPPSMTVSSPALTVETLPTSPTRSGYAFIEWNTQADGGGTAFTASTTVTANITVYARWQIVSQGTSYVVTFNSNGGDTDADPSFLPVASPATTVGTLPTQPTRSGYIFIGWNTQAGGGGSAFTASTLVTASITVYAQWGSGGSSSQNITLSFSDQGTGAANRNSFTVQQNGSPASETINLIGGWTGAEWLVDGEGRGSGSSIMINAADYTVGGHTLQVLVHDGTKYWSKTIPFTVTAAVTGISLNRTELRLPQGGSATLIASISPANAANQGKNWSSDNSNIATVTDGVVTGVTLGTTTIWVASLEKPAIKVSCAVTVEAAQDITLSFNDKGAEAASQNSFTVQKGGTPQSETISLVGSWTTGNWLVDGEDRGSGPSIMISAADYTVGGHTLQVLVQGGSKYWSQTIPFTVTAAVTGIGLNRSDLRLPLGGSATLIANIIPTNAANQGKTWWTADATIATVADGVVTAVAAGTTTIWVASQESGAIRTSCTVTVAPAQHVTLNFTDQGAGAFIQNSFTVSRSGSPVGISLAGGWSTGTWLVDGEGRGTGKNFTVSASDYTLGGHTLQVLVQDGLKYWSRTIQFTVSN